MANLRSSKWINENIDGISVKMLDDIQNVDCHT